MEMVVTPHSMRRRVCRRGSTAKGEARAARAQPTGAHTPLRRVADARARRRPRCGLIAPRGADVAGPGATRRGVHGGDWRAPGGAGRRVGDEWVQTPNDAAPGARRRRGGRPAAARRRTCVPLGAGPGGGRGDAGADGGGGVEAGRGRPDPPSGSGKTHLGAEDQARKSLGRGQAGLARPRRAHLLYVRALLRWRSVVSPPVWLWPGSGRALAALWGQTRKGFHRTSLTEYITLYTCGLLLSQLRGGVAAGDPSCARAPGGGA